MFERFTTEARQVVVQAQTEAREIPHGCVGTEHLLMALAGQPSATGAVLTGHGLTRDAVADAVRRELSGQDLDADALTALGIDLDAVRERVEAVFGEGALDSGRRTPAGRLPFSPRAKKVLELALREAIALKSKSISDGHLALGLLREGEGLAMKVIHDRGVDPATLREEIRLALAS
jgi:ATP-dependent Clp protease ATP-binding subunit ClpA